MIIRGSRPYAIPVKWLNAIELIALFCVTFFKELFPQHLGAETTKHVKFVNEFIV